MNVWRTLQHLRQRNARNESMNWELMQCYRVSLNKEVHPHHVMPSPPELLFDNAHPHQVMASPQDLLIWQGPSSPHDANSTRVYCLKRSTLIIWCQVHKKFLFDMVHPHHVMPSPQEFLFDTVHHHQEWCQVDKNSSFDKSHPHHLMPSLQEFFIWYSPPSSRNAPSTRIYCWTRYSLIKWHKSTRFICSQRSILIKVAGWLLLSVSD